MSAWDRYRRERTETRTAYCPVCRARWEPHAAAVSVERTACCARCARAYLALWRPVHTFLAAHNVPWDALTTAHVQAAQDAAHVQAAQDAATAARGQCVQCAAPMTTGHRRCAACRAQQAAYWRGRRERGGG